ncbi:helix-turn-helix domain-containing protein [Bacteroidetes bacterium endosymbiont of Geopemphigus sp.]|uniref:helix-turn-helix domain-containing protein n=1 Tax=Bacteroidetes bacterium endosymbiont of Geopemphigus sp. TaxID=2047937 RepID=UPI000CD0256A|nr:helix-turn-helix domain-containing protein [Bacteroidetes bacterium endosymbiont of Geopemphigus sp.]
MNLKEQSYIRRNIKVLDHAKKTANIFKTCKYFGISRDRYYNWKRAYEEKGATTLINKKTLP